MGVMKTKSIYLGNCLCNITLILSVFFLIGLMLDPLGAQLNVFFAKTDNFMADFFNVQIYIAGWDPYHNPINGSGEKAYLPFTYLILELFNGFFNYSSANLSDCYCSSTAMMSCILFTLISVFLLYHSMNCIQTIPSKVKFVILFSSVMLFSIERGNIIIFCAALICYFLAFKNSEDNKLRLFSLLCLCVVSVIKIYPAVLGLYLLAEKRYKDILRCIAISIFLIFTPFFFFKGQLENIPQLYENVISNTDSYSPYQLFPRFGLVHLFAWPLKGLHVDTNLSDLILIAPKLVMCLACVLSFVMFYYEKNSWKKIALVSLPLIMFPTNSAFYCGLYFIPVILFFLYHNEGRKIDYIYMLLICVFLNPFQLLVVKGISISQNLSNIALLTTWLILLYECLSCFIKQKKGVLNN